jgi:hypothetical protein
LSGVVAEGNRVWEITFGKRILKVVAIGVR